MNSSTNVLETIITVLIALAAMGLLGIFSKRSVGLKAVSLVGFLAFLALSVHSERFIVAALDAHDSVYAVAHEQNHSELPTIAGRVQNDKQGSELFFIETEEEDNQLTFKRHYRETGFSYLDNIGLYTSYNSVKYKLGQSPFESHLHNSDRYLSYISVFTI